jgi:hypothetical protein
MKRFIAGIVVCAAATGGLVAVAADPAERVAAPNISTFMRLKLSHTQQVLEGIALEDFEQIAKHAQSMALLSEDEKWMVFQTPEYRRHSAVFLEICRTLQRSG